MKTKLVLAMCAALLISSAAMAAQSDDQSDNTVNTVKTTTTTQHFGGHHETWYKEGGVVPTEYRGDTYVVQRWQNEHLNEPAQGSRWMRGDNGDYVLVNQDTGMITSISHHH
ncbi:MAG TPA: RcnB family protein [Rhodanobacter sp.]|nr:RcnB family protein [Rhodanobacter sp.]